MPLCIALCNYDPGTQFRHRLLKYRLNMVGTGNIRTEEASDMEDFSVDEHTCQLMADVVCGDLP